jgi:hypothetical protein
MVYLCVMLAPAGCVTKRTPVYIERLEKDTTVVTDTVIQVRLTPYRDSVSVAGDSSFLSNEYAYSYASYREGRLSHSLGIRPQAVATGRLAWQTRYKTLKETTPVEVVKEVPVKRPLGGWQRFLLVSGGVAWGVLMAGLAVLVRRLFRASS